MVLQFSRKHPCQRLDFKETNYLPESVFIQENRHLPLVFLHPNGTMSDINGELAVALSLCKEGIGVGHCRFISSLSHTNNLHVYLEDGNVSEIVDKLLARDGIYSASAHLGNSDVIGMFVYRDS